jgi:ATP-dependent helicase/nuclease subunit B
MSFPIVVSSSSASRLSAARQFLRERASVLVIGASRGAADDLARSVAAEGPATFGVHRLSLPQLAARAAVVPLAAEGAAPSTWLGAEAVSARAVFDARELLEYFEPVAGMPGFPRALARTIQELRLNAVDGASLGAVPLAGPDLRALLDRFESAFEVAGTADRARLFEVAAVSLRQRPIADAMVLLDVPLDHRADRELVRAAIAGTSSVFATVPFGDQAAIDALVAMGGVVQPHDDAGRTSLQRLQRHLFVDVPRHTLQPADGGRDVGTAGDAAPLDGTVQFFSAPGEGRECVEMARRILNEAKAGVRFDEMAIFVRSPHSYFGLLEHALRRADIPAWFDRGTRRPHAAGRAFLALLACAAEQLSSARFAEYLSLGQVPDAEQADAAGADEIDELFGRSPDRPNDELEEESAQADAAAEAATADSPVLAGTVRAPWKWERLLVQSAVIGRDAGRWRRRLDGYAAALDAQIDHAHRQEGDDGPKVRGLRIAREELNHLRAFALPVIDILAAWPVRAAWGEWLDLLERLAQRALRAPARVLRVLADLRPMAVVGPVDLDEVRRVLSDRLLTLESDPPSRRFGRVFVGMPQQARGRAFRIVFVPGLAERMFPQRPREDPLLLDEMRRVLIAGASRSSQVPGSIALATQEHRLGDERRLLQLAAGAASARLYVSYPRIELSESRARVPSFYALDVMRAATGRVPDHEQLEALAREAGQATLAWPAPPRAADAIDDQEHDLAVLRGLLDREPGTVRGHAHYLLRLNDALRRSVVARWARGDRRWSPSDGLVRVTPNTSEPLAAKRLRSQTYSLSALQRFASCPYQFLLSAIYRLQPLEQVEPLQRLDPLLRGSIFHEIQAAFFKSLRSAGALPVTSATLAAAHDALELVVARVADERHEQLAPAVERVWADEIASIGRDLHAWLELVAADGEEWEPKYFEFSFGTVPGERDLHSTPDDVVFEEGFRLRGAVDLIEEHRKVKGVLRITDHKTGRRPDKIDNVIIGGGSVLQPVLYGMAIERVLGQLIESSRLSYCTSAGGFSTHAVPISERTRAYGVEALTIIDRAIETGFLAAAPKEDACGRCDFRSVCGPNEFRRVLHKPDDRLGDLKALRKLP